MNHLVDERDVEQVVRGWMHHDDEYPADRNRQVGRIMGRIDETRQRRGAWRLLPFRRGAKRVDEDDEDLYVASGGAVAVRRGASTAMAVAAMAALLVVGVTFVSLLPTRVAGPGAQTSPSPAPTIRPDDVALQAAFAGTWSGERTSLADVLAVYATDAVHTAHWLDRVDRFAGPSEILERIHASLPVTGGEWVPLPDAVSGEHRYLSVVHNLGGTACVIWVRDALVTRHDCILPTASSGSGMTALVPPAADTLEVQRTIMAEFAPGWGTADRALIERTVSPQIVHHVAYDNAETRLVGIDAYMSIMGYGEPEELAAPIPLRAPSGEHRWTDFSGVAGGSLCTFWERDGLIVRHDCIVPTFSYVPPREPDA